MEERISRRGFIRLGAALGVGAAGASILTACGGGSGGSGGGGNGGGSGGGAAGAGGAQTTATRPPAETTGAVGATKAQTQAGDAIARVSEVRPGSAVKFEDRGQPAVLVRLDGGDFAAYSAVCTHQGCTVAYKNGQLACPCHGSVFDPANNGAVVSPPAQRPLPEIPVEVRGGEVYKA